MPKSLTYDLAILGSGPAGYRAAVQASRLKKSVCIVEKTPDRVGGSWVHTGTIPSKTLRESMERIHAIRFHAGSQWVDRVVADLSTAKLLGRSRKVAMAEEAIMRRYFERYNIHVISGFGTIESETQLRVIPTNGEPQIINAGHLLIATGSRPRRPDNIPFDGWRVVDGDEILRLECLPKTIVIYGGGIIGCEYACIFAALGVKTIVVDNRNTIMQHADHEVALALVRYMEDLGVEFVLGQNLQEVKIDGARVITLLSGGTALESDVHFFAAGRVPNTERLGLDRLGITTTDRGHLVVGEHFQTTTPNIYAAGDVIGAPALAATSASQGRHCALHMFGKTPKTFTKLYPLGVYTIPELSSVGSTEKELIAQGVDFVVGRAHYTEVARGYISGDEHGLLKMLVCRRSQKILGLHIVGGDACNLIHIGLAFMQKNGHAQDFVEMVFNYPTLAEAYRIAAFNALNKVFPNGEIGDPPDEAEPTISPLAAVNE